MMRIREKYGLCSMLCGVVAVSAALTLAAQAADEGKAGVVVKLSQLQNEIFTLRNNLSTTVSALEDLKSTAEKGGDLAKPYASYTSAYGTLDEQVTKMRERGTAVKARAKEHWEAWQNELSAMRNENLREKAQSRYNATVKEFEKISEKVDSAKQVLAPLLADMKDINTYLKTDLSKDAVNSLSNTIWKMGKSSKTADARIGDVAEQIDKVIKKMPQT